MTWAAARNIAALRRNFASIKGTATPPRSAASLSQRAFQIGLGVRQAARLDRGPVVSCLDEFTRGALHEIAASRESELAAATGFVLAHAARAAQKRAILWIAEDISRAESGALYGPGLDALKPERLIIVSVARARDVLWAMEEALHCRAVGAVIGEIRTSTRGKSRVDLLATRRLSLAAARNSGLAFLLRSAPVAEASAATTRWIVGAAPSAPLRHGLSPPRVSARLVRNRRGPLGCWVLEWNSEKRFDLATADRESLVEAPRDRSHHAATA